MDSHLSLDLEHQDVEGHEVADHAEDGDADQGDAEQVLDLGEESFLQ